VIDNIGAAHLEAVRCMHRSVLLRGALRIGALFLLLSVASCRGEMAGIPAGSSEAIRAYLVQRNSVTSKGGEVFCAFEPLAEMRRCGDKNDVYLWVLCQEYYLDGEAIQEGTGSSLPMPLTLEARGSTYTVLESRVPGEVAQSTELVHEYFPRSAWRKIIPQTAQDSEEHNARVERLQSQVHDQAVVAMTGRSK